MVIYSYLSPQHSLQGSQCLADMAYTENVDIRILFVESKGKPHFRITL